MTYNFKLKTKSIINGILYIGENETNTDIVIFKTKCDFGINVYLFNKKINLRKDGNKWIYKFQKAGKYKLKIIFNFFMNDFTQFFEKCSNIISLDLSNWNTSNVIDMSFMFNECYNLKEIKGINKLVTNKVNNINSMFQCCYELKYLDLSNWNTSNVLYMSFMFKECYILREIK